MKFLAPGGGTHQFGIFINPDIRGIPKGIQEGKTWAADNGAYTGLNEIKFLEMLQRFEPYKATCLFVVVPDLMANAHGTLELFEIWAPRLATWPLAFVAQDGQEEFPIPSQCSTVFIGGSTEWKKSPKAIRVIKQGQAQGKHIHIGRVNYRKRYHLFSQIEGSEEFTCDGTRPRYERDECFRDWAKLENEKSLPLW